LWKYDISSNIWTWIHGGNTTNQNGEKNLNMERHPHFFPQESTEPKELEQRVQLLAGEVAQARGLILMGICGCSVEVSGFGQRRK